MSGEKPPFSAQPCGLAVKQSLDAAEGCTINRGQWVNNLVGFRGAELTVDEPWILARRLNAACLAPEMMPRAAAENEKRLHRTCCGGATTGGYRPTNIPVGRVTDVTPHRRAGRPKSTAVCLERQYAARHQARPCCGLDMPPA